MPFSRKSDRRKACFHLRTSRILFAAKHSWTTLHISRPLFVGSYICRLRVGLSANEKEGKFTSNDNNALSVSWNAIS